MTVVARAAAASAPQRSLVIRDFVETVVMTLFLLLENGGVKLGSHSGFCIAACLRFGGA